MRLREIKFKLDRKNNGTQDRNGNRLSVKDVVKILEGPCKVRISTSCRLSFEARFWGLTVLLFFPFFRENKALLNIFTKGFCLFTTGITLSMLALFVPKLNPVCWLVDHEQMLTEMYVGCISL